jgi:hypothetical protein
MKKIQKILKEDLKTNDNKFTSMLQSLRKDKNSFWVGSQFEWVKTLTPTEKGNIGEDYLKNILENMGVDSEILERRRGDYDLKIKLPKNKHKTSENKTATLDVHGSFQFNGIKINREYDFIFAFGIAPNSIRYKIVFFDELQNGDYTFGSMTKKNDNEDKNSLSYKLTIPYDKMESFENFEEEFTNKILNNY